MLSVRSTKKRLLTTRTRSLNNRSLQQDERNKPLPVCQDWRRFFCEQANHIKRYDTTSNSAVVEHQAHRKENQMGERYNTYVAEE